VWTVVGGIIATACQPMQHRRKDKRIVKPKADHPFETNGAPAYGRPSAAFSRRNFLHEDLGAELSCIGDVELEK